MPNIQLKDLTEAQKKAYVIADNKLALNAGWDATLLKLELENLKHLGFELEILGFNSKEIEDLNIFDVVNDVDEKHCIDEIRNLLMIECVGERELEKLYEEMKERGFECKILS